MKRFIAQLLLLLVAFSASTQELVHEIDLPLKGKGQSLFIPNISSPKLLVFEAKNIRSISLQTGNVFTYEAELLNKAKILGYSVTEENDIAVYTGGPGYMSVYHLFVEYNDFKKIPLSFATPKGETYLTSISQNGFFYLLTVTKKTSKLNFYKFQGYKSLGVNSVDLGEYFPRKSLSEYLKGSTTTPGTIQMARKPNLSHQPIIDFLAESGSTSLSKLFVADSTIHITLDHESRNTKVISLQPDEAKFSFKSISHSGRCVSGSSLYEVNSSNSYISESKLYQTKICEDGIKIKVSNLDGSLIKDWQIDESTDIQSFFNTYSYVFETKKDFSKAIKQLSKLDAGIKAQTYGTNVFLTFGGTKTYSNMGGVPGNSSSQSGWIQSKLSKDLEKANTDAKSSIEEIEQYLDELTGSRRYEHLFELDDIIHLSVFSPSMKKLSIIKFQ